MMRAPYARHGQNSPELSSVREGAVTVHTVRILATSAHRTAPLQARAAGAFGSPRSPRRDCREMPFLDSLSVLD